MRVRAKVTCFVENGYREEGTSFEYNGPPNDNLERLDGKTWADKVPRKKIEDDLGFEDFS